jgi:hypothetical protein
VYTEYVAADLEALAFIGDLTTRSHDSGEATQHHESSCEGSNVINCNTHNYESANRTRYSHAHTQQLPDYSSTQVISHTLLVTGNCAQPSLPCTCPSLHPAILPLRHATIVSLSGHPSQVVSKFPQPRSRIQYRLHLLESEYRSTRGRTHCSRSCCATQRYAGMVGADSGVVVGLINVGRKSASAENVELASILFSAENLPVGIPRLRR